MRVEIRGRVCSTSNFPDKEQNIDERQAPYDWNFALQWLVLVAVGGMVAALLATLFAWRVGQTAEDMLGGAAALLLILVVGDTFGVPGSVEYMTYETFNHIMALLLALQTCTLIAFFISQHEVLGKSNKRLLTIALVAWAAMAIGTAAEFWLYSDLPYPNSPADFNMRTLAFSLFFFASLNAGVALLVLGLRLAQSGILHRFFVTVLLLYLPQFIASFFAGLSIFTAPALASITIAGLALKRR